MEGFISLGQGGSNSNDQMMMMMTMMMGSEAGVSSSSSSVVSCEDCGNQAKKDCCHTRCRTCCRSRGFDCPTHLKSTWVPASVRRERHLQQDGGIRGDGAPKRGRRGRRSSTNYNSATQLGYTNTGMETGMNNSYLPGEVNTTALFKCIRVSSIDDTREEYAYQTAVTIGGHVFKGLLYDQGPEHPGPTTTTTTTYMYQGDAFSLPGGMMASALVGSSSSSPYIDHSMYPVPLTSSYMLHTQPGTHFFPNSNPPRS